MVVAGVERKAHYLAMDLPHSDDGFVAAFPAETTEAFLEGHVRAFAYFGGVPTRILYDNTKIAVARMLGDGQREKTRAFSELQSYYLFAEKFGRPAKGNDKGKVEGLVGYVRRNFMVPIPRVNSWDELNAHLEAECRKRRQRRLRGHTETIGERFERDRLALLPLPSSPYEACEKQTARSTRCRSDGCKSIVCGSRKKCSGGLFRPHRDKEQRLWTLVNPERWPYKGSSLSNC